MGDYLNLHMNKILWFGGHCSAESTAEYIEDRMIMIISGGLGSDNNFHSFFNSPQPEVLRTAKITIIRKLNVDSFNCEWIWLEYVAFLLYLSSNDLQLLWLFLVIAI